MNISLRAAQNVLAMLFAFGIGFAQSVTPLASLTGFSDSPHEKNGKIVTIEVAAKLDIRISGTYRVTLHLTSGNGKSVSGDARGRLGIGPQILPVLFDAKQIDRLGQDGPYRLTDVLLLLQNPDRVVDSKDDAGLTRPYQLADFYHELYYFTGNFEAAGANPTPEGKFATLRVSFGVVTTGGMCSWWGTLSDGQRREIDFENGNTTVQTLPPGKSTLTLDFPGFKIANRGVDGPLIVPSLGVRCGLGGEGEIMDNTRHQTAVFHSSDFDNPAPDFQVHDAEMPPIAPGDTTGFDVGLRTIGDLDYLKIEYVAEADNPKIHLRPPGVEGTACSTAPSCWQGHGSSVRVETEADLPAGTYTIQYTARAVGKEHKAQVKLVVDPEVARARLERAKALEALKAGDDVQPDTPVVPVQYSGGAEAVHPEVTFSMDAALRKMHAVLVLDQSSSMIWGGSCDYMKAAAARFSQLFVEGRDSVSVISFGGGVHVLLPLTDQFLQDAPQSISTLQCNGVTNTGEALEIAQEELARHEDPDAMKTVVLFTDGQPTALVASLPVKPGQCLGPFLGELPVLIEASGLESRVYPPDPDENDEARPDAKVKRGSCLAQQNIYNFPYLPEQDLRGVSVVGSHPLQRFADGPYAGRIRFDVPGNVLNAVANEVENAVRRLHAAPNPILVYVIGFENRSQRPIPLDYLRLLANDPSSARFDPKKPAGMAILTHDPEAFFPAFQSVRQDLVKHAMVPQ